MRVAHLLIVHKNPAQLERLIRAMQHEQFDFYIHLDKKVDDSAFRYLANLDRVYFIENRIRVAWAGYSTLKSILNSMEEIMQRGIDYRFINLMSAQDYPLRSAQFLYEYLDDRQQQSFISCSLPNAEAWWTTARTRITSYHLTDYDFKGRYLVQRLINRIMPTRRFPLPITLYGSSSATWWTMNIDCARYVVDYMKANKKLERFLRLTWCPDEFLIPTLLMSSPFGPQIVNDNLRYIDWSEGNARPKTLRLTDFDALKHSDKLIARKFDADIDTHVLDKLDASIQD